jgi:glutamate-1-semialdehyde 2,1-aminomutase
MPPDVAEGVVVLPYNDLEGAEQTIRGHKDELACVIMEAVSSSFGYVPGDAEFLLGIREITRELGILLVYDEVQSFRVAPGGAQEWSGIVPDMTALGKIIGGGLPVGAFGGREDIMALFDPSGGGPVIPHSGTFNANPMTMVAGYATLEHLTPEVYQRLDRLGGTLRQKLQAVFDELDVEAQVTGIASLFGIHFTSEEITDYRSMLKGDTDMAQRLFTGLLNEGVLLQATCAGALNTLTTEEDVDTLVDAVRRVTERVRG